MKRLSEKSIHSRPTAVCLIQKKQKFHEEQNPGPYKLEFVCIFKSQTQQKNT